MRKLVWPLVIVLLALVIQLGMTLHGVASMTSRSSSATPIKSIDLFGQAAAQFPLPAPPARGQPAWPPAHQVQIDRLSFHVDRVGTWHVDADGRTTHQMSVERIGIPLASVHHIRRWWPWDDPAWAPLDRDRGVEETVFLWHAIAINALLTALVLALPIVLVRLALAARAAKRWRAGHCRACGYDLAGLSMCPECGLAASDGKPAHSAAMPSPVP